MKKLFWGLALIVTVSFIGIMSGCGAVSSSETTTSTSAATTTTTATTTTLLTLTAEYFPNTNGNNWTYKATLYDSAWTTPTLEGTAEVVFNGTRVLPDGIKIAQVLINTSNIPPMLSTMETYLIATNSEVKEYGDSAFSPTSEASQVDLVFPSVAGDKWIFSPSSGITSEALSQESVTVPAGTYDCFKVTFIQPASFGSSNIDSRWYAKNVGIVKQIKMNCDASGEVINSQTLELRSKNP